MRSSMKIDTNYHCPSCKSKEVIEYDEFIECTSCHLEFFKEGLDKIDDENQLSVQELKGIVKSFDEFKEKKTRNEFSKSLSEDK